MKTLNLSLNPSKTRIEFFETLNHMALAYSIYLEKLLEKHQIRPRMVN